VTGQWFSPRYSVSSTNKTDCHDITEILLKVAVNTLTLYFSYKHYFTGHQLSQDHQKEDLHQGEFLEKVQWRNQRKNQMKNK
jgi:hypothetical protein